MVLFQGPSVTIIHVLSVRKCANTPLVCCLAFCRPLESGVTTNTTTLLKYHTTCRQLLRNFWTAGIPSFILALDSRKDRAPQTACADEVADRLKAEVGVVLDKKNIKVPRKVGKKAGSLTVELTLHKTIVHELKVRRAFGSRRSIGVRSRKQKTDRWTKK